MKKQNTISSSLMANLWQNSFTHKILSKIGRSLINSLNKSFIVSKLLNDKNIYGENGSLKGIIGKAKAILYKLFNAIRNLFSKSIAESYLLSGIRDINSAITSDVYRFLSILFGTGLFSYSILSLAKGIYSMKRILFFMVLGILPLIIGFLNVKTKIIFTESKFVGLIRKIFDYNS